MDLNSSFELLDGRDDLLYLASYRCGIRIHHLVGWIGDTGRQIRSLSGRDALARFAGFTDSNGTEDARFRIGERLSVFERDGRLQRFKILGVRREGDLNIYLARDLDNFNLCSLKENSLSAFDPGTSDQQLAHSAALSLQLADHPNFVSTISAFRLRGRLVVQTDYPLENAICLGEIEPNGIPVATAVKYAIQICRAMAHAHTVFEGFVHGSLKPSNCYVTPEGLLKLGGLETARAGQTDDGSFDIRSFALMLCEFLSGAAPLEYERFKGKVGPDEGTEPVAELTFKNDIPEALVRLIKECLVSGSEEVRTSFSVLEEKLTEILRIEFEEDPPEPIFCAPTRGDLVRRAKSLASVGREEEATKCIDAAIERFGPEADLYAVRAVVTCCGPRLSEAVDASASALKSGSDRFIVLLSRARVLLAQGRSEAAEKFLKRALNLEPYNCVALNMLGEVYLEKGYLREAWICFDQSVKIEGSQIDPLEGLARIDLRTGSFQKAIAKANQVIDLDPHRASSHKILGDAFRELGNLVEAVGSYKAAVQTGKGERGFSRAFVRACHDLCSKQGIPSKAPQLRYLIEGTRLYARKKVGKQEADRFAARLLGIVRADGFEPGSIFYFDGVLAMIAPIVDRRYARQLNRELTAIWDMIRDCNAEQHVLNSLGRCLYQLGNVRKCLEVFEHSLERFGPDENSFRHIAACFETEGDLDKCLKFYRKAQECADSESIRANLNRVKSKLTARKYLPKNTSISQKLQSQAPLL
ncbi:MAG: tetratricopeptide repeat protein [Aridibacter famidurans]|nr:tetratricopeptide repeat protein [Aridibacter famidurans]